MSQEIIAVLSSGVDYYKGDTPVKGVDYFTQEDIQEIVDQVDESIDLSSYAPKAYVDEAIEQLEIPSVDGLASEAYVDEAIEQLVIPTKVSDLDNDSGFLTSQSLEDYATKTYVNTAIGNIDCLKKQVVNVLPLTDIDTNTIYMVPSVTSTQDNVYDEFMYIGGNWEFLGDTQVDLSDYATISYVDSQIASATYSLPTATTSTLGGVKVDGSSIVADSNGVISTLLRDSYDHLLEIKNDTTFGFINNEMAYDINEVIRRLRQGEKLSGVVMFSSNDLINALKAIHNSIGCFVINADGSYTELHNLQTSTAYFPSIYWSMYYYMLEEWGDSFTLFISQSNEGFRKFLGRHLGYQKSGVNASTISGAIDELADRVPANSASAGNYKLVSSTTAGSATYAWAEDISYTLPVATTSTLGGVMVDGSSIVVDQNGVISTTGSSYTAGSGIEIDEDGVISSINSLALIIGKVTSNLTLANNGYGISVNNKTDAVNYLRKHQVIFPSSGDLQFETLTKEDMGLTALVVVDFTKAKNNYGGSPQPSISNSGINFTLNGYMWFDGKIVYTWQNVGDLNYCLQIYNQNGNKSLGKLLSDITTRIPSNTATNGDYKLISSTTAGNATYSWVEDSGSTSYTAGSGIDITNNVISTTGTFSGSYNDLTDKPTIPPAYTLPVATTSTLGGVKVDGETITISDGVISAASGGDSEYTAGVGIDISQDGVISTFSRLPDWNLMNGPGIGGQTIQQTDNPAIIKQVAYLTIDNKQEIINYLLQHYIVKITRTPDSSDQYKIYPADLGLSDNQIKYYDFSTGGSSYALRYSVSTGFLYFNGKNLYFWQNLADIIKGLYVKYGSKTGQLGTILNDLNTRIPSNTVTNGDYKLVSSTTAGNVTYSWVEDISLPPAPQATGNYVLKCVVADGVATYSWIEQ